ncbi:MAG: NYN domain-containing protein [bacterium]
MTYRKLIIDGYSLLHRDPELAPLLAGNLMTARQRLIQSVERIAGTLSDKTTIVFDGRGKEFPLAVDSTLVEIVFSPPDKTADTVIERLVHADTQPEEILVVTSDRGERETVTAAGAEVMSCAQFIDLSRRKDTETKHTARKMQQSRPKPTLGDFFPK